jgi:hypothetical protein
MKIDPARHAAFPGFSKNSSLGQCRAIPEHLQKRRAHQGRKTLVANKIVLKSKELTSIALTCLKLRDFHGAPANLQRVCEVKNGPIQHSFGFSEETQCLFRNLTAERWSGHGTRIGFGGYDFTRTVVANANHGEDTRFRTTDIDSPHVRA